MTNWFQFDFFDSRIPFAIEVPQRTRTNRSLANAVFALSARHLSGTTGFDELIADHYLQECLRTLIPTLEDSEAVMDDDLLATLVILRMLEEMDGMFAPCNISIMLKYLQYHLSDQIYKVIFLAHRQLFALSKMTPSHPVSVK